MNFHLSSLHVKFADFVDISQIDTEDDSEDDSFSKEEMVTMLSFFNDCSVQELAAVPGLSSKKAEKIIKMRPFESWTDLVRKQLLPHYIHCSGAYWRQFLSLMK